VAGEYALFHAQQYMLCVYTVTDAGPCPNDACRNGGVCRGRTDGTLFCDCPSPDLQAPVCDVATASPYGKPWTCQYDIKCIVPAIIVPVVCFLLIIIIVLVFIIIFVIRRHRRQDYDIGHKDEGRNVEMTGQRRTVVRTNSSFENDFEEKPYDTIMVRQIRRKYNSVHFGLLSIDVTKL